MLDHVGQDAADMIILRAIEHLLAATLGAQNTGGAQQTQVMTHQGRRGAGLLRDIGDGARPVETGNNDGEPGAIAE